MKTSRSVFLSCIVASIVGIASAQQPAVDRIDSLVARVDAGDDAAYREALALAARTPPGEDLERLAEASGRYALQAPTAFLEAQKQRDRCFGIDMFPTETIDTPVMQLRETAMRLRALNGVKSPALQRIRSICLRQLAQAASSDIKVSLWVDEASVPGNLDDTALEKAGYVAHPCGMVRDVRTRALGKDGTDEALEFDGAGRITRRWRVPVDAVPYAVLGDRLLFSNAGMDVLSVDAKGHLARIDPMSAEATYLPREPGSLQCPQQVRAAFDASPSLVCRTLDGARGGPQHRIAYQTVCS